MGWVAGRSMDGMSQVGSVCRNGHDFIKLGSGQCVIK